MKLTPFPLLAHICLLTDQILRNPELKNFGRLLRRNPVLLATLAQSGHNLTVFAPRDGAFAGGGDRPVDLSYHVSYAAVTEEDLRTAAVRVFVGAGNASLWVSRCGRGVYVNNARVVESFEVSWRGHVVQVLHITDSILDPIVPQPSTALDVFPQLSNHTFFRFLHILKRHNLTHLYETPEGRNTYLVPTDAGFEDFPLPPDALPVILGHVIPHRVLFVRPTEKNFQYEVLGNSNYAHAEVYFGGGERKEVGSVTTRADRGQKIGRFTSQIVLGNVPVTNGVVHVIRNPLGVPKKRTLFPFLPVLAKVSADPYLSESHALAQKSGVNDYLTANAHNDKFTYFIPRDKSWKEFPPEELACLRSRPAAYYPRHLVISNAPYTMEALEIYTRVLAPRRVQLTTVSGGILAIRVTRRDDDDSYVIAWGGFVIPVYAPDYECEDGMVHVIGRAFVDGRDLDALSLYCSTTIFQCFGNFTSLLTSEGRCAWKR